MFSKQHNYWKYLTIDSLKQNGELDPRPPKKRPKPYVSPKITITGDKN